MFVIIELFCSLLRLRLYKRKSVEEGWVTLSADFWGKGASPTNQDFRGKEALPTNHCWYQSRSDCPFVWYQNTCSAPFRFVTIHACDRRKDRQMDRQNYDSQDHPRICSRGINYYIPNVDEISQSTVKIIRLLLPLFKTHPLLRVLEHISRIDIIGYSNP